MILAARDVATANFADIALALPGTNVSGLSLWAAFPHSQLHAHRRNSMKNTRGFV